MRKLGTLGGVATWLGANGDLLFVPQRDPSAASGVRDPGGVVSDAIRICAAKNARRKKEQR